MAEIKFTKNALRAEQTRLGQLQKYLPTLQLKKSLLQIVVNEARQEIVELEQRFNKSKTEADRYSSLLGEHTVIDPTKIAKVIELNKRYENIAGVEVPYFTSIKFVDADYSLIDTPAWVDAVIIGLRDLAESYAKIQIAKEKKDALEYELRQVSIRVNLFEKVLIPRAEVNIKKIKVFLGDQLLAAIGQIKVAKTKIEERKEEARELAKQALEAGRN